MPSWDLTSQTPLHKHERLPGAGSDYFSVFPVAVPGNPQAGSVISEHYIILKAEPHQEADDPFTLSTSPWGSSTPGSPSMGSPIPPYPTVGAGGEQDRAPSPTVSLLTLEMRVPAAVRVSRVLSSGYLLMTWRRMRRVSPSHSWASDRCSGSLGSAREGG